MQPPVGKDTDQGAAPPEGPIRKTHRFRRSREGLTPDELKDRDFHNRVGVLIAIMSILGALIAWRASVASNIAADLAQVSVQQNLTQQQLQAEIGGQVSQDLRLFPQYQEHVKNWKYLTRDAANLKTQDPATAQELEDEGKEELALARASINFSPTPRAAGHLGRGGQRRL